MKLNKLIIHGFKSFADPVEVRFEEGVTGVVGPNGCGKSNIADAVRWVLGEQSAKALRGARMEDVIFNGTEKRRRLAFCEVSLVFDNSDRALAVDYTEVQVTRRMYRSGESEYSLNNHVCRRSDIIELFRDTGIGKEGYSIVGQGRIDEILSQKSEDRRAVFEEAAGVMKFKTRKLDAERKIEHTRDNRSRIEDILSELESRVEPLRQQSEAAREYIALREEQKKLDLNAFLIRSERWNARLTELQQDMAACEEMHSSAQAEMEQASQERDRAQIELDARESEAADARELVQKAIAAHDETSSALAVIRERVSSAEKERERLDREFSVAVGGERAAREAAERLSEDLEREKKELEGLTARRDEAIKAREEADRIAGELEETARSEEQRLIDDMNRLSDARSREAALKGLLQAITAQKQRIVQDEEREKSAGASLAEHMEEEKRKYDIAGSELSRAEKDYAQAEAAEREATQKQDFARASLNDERLENRQNASRLHLLEEMQKEYDGYQGSVRQVLMMSRKMPNSGVHGVVADILHVPEKLERALDMALGGALQNIVVDRDEDAKRMIDYLRTNRLGRATFLPIGSVRGNTLSPQERKVLSMPGCLGVASELVSFDPLYRGIVESLLGRTVIAEDLAQGIAIQRAGGYRFRLVTLEGDVMHSGGSMTGGSVQSRATSLLSRTREIEDLRKKQELSAARIAQLEKDIEALDKERASAREERQALQQELVSRRVALARAEEQYNASKSEMDAHTQRVQRLTAALEQLDQQRQDSENELAELAGLREDAGSVREDREQKVTELKEQLSKAREAAQKAAENVTREMVACAALERTVEANEKELARLHSVTDESALSQEEVKASLEKAQALLDELKKSEKELGEKLAAAQETLERERNAFNEKDKLRVSTQKNIQVLTQRVDEKRTALDAANERKHRIELQTARLDSDIRQMTDRIWEDYSMTLADAEPYREEGFKLQDSDRRVAAIKDRIRALGTVNVSALDEYRETVARVEDMSSQRDDLVKAEEDLSRIIHELELKMDRQFREKLALIDDHFRRIFADLFGGGRAEIRLEDSEDPLRCGIDIVAQPPGKKLVSLSLLSGGERALTAIALLFAILEINPSPFCILDEIEAALDDANIDNYADFLRSYARRTQFVVITHRKGTMERCDALYGVVMEEKGISKTVGVTLGEAVAHA